MSILNLTKLMYPKQLSVLLAVLMLLSPIVSSADALLMGKTPMPHHSVSISNEITVDQSKHESCHKSSDQSGGDSIMAGVDSTKDCCDEPCLCAQAGCQSSTAVFYKSELLLGADRTFFSFDLSSYLNPQTSPFFPPPIS